MLAQNLIPLLEVDFINPIRCRIALKCVIPGFFANLASLFTVKLPIVGKMKKIKIKMVRRTDINLKVNVITVAPTAIKKETAGKRKQQKIKKVTVQMLRKKKKKKKKQS